MKPEAERLERQSPAPCHRRRRGAEQNQDEPGGAGGRELESPVGAGAAPRRRIVREWSLDAGADVAFDLADQLGGKRHIIELPGLALAVL